MRDWLAYGPLSRPGARRRYLTVLVVFGLLAATPAVVAALPASTSTASAATLLARLKTSGDIPYTGLTSTSGQLALPDIGLANSVTALLSSTTRARTWWESSTRYRVDQQTLDGENDIYRDGDATWTWESSSRTAVYATDPPQLVFPTVVDVLPGPLARRLLAQAPASQVTVGGSDRVARHDARLITWRPDDPRSLIGEVRVWLNPDSGFAYAVEIRAVGGKARAFSSSFLDVSLQAPDPARLVFEPDRDPTANVQREPEGANQGFNFVPLPDTLGGLKQRSPQEGFFATYGEGASVVAVSAQTASSFAPLRGSIDSPGRPPIKGAFGEGSLISTSLVNALVFTSGPFDYALVGSVTREQLEKMALDLERS